MNIISKIYKVTKTSGNDSLKYFCFTVERKTSFGTVNAVLCLTLNPKNQIVDYFLTEKLEYCKKYFTFVKDKFLDYDETIVLLEKFNALVLNNPELKIENIR